MYIFLLQLLSFPAVNAINFDSSVSFYKTIIEVISFTKTVKHIQNFNFELFIKEIQFQHRVVQKILGMFSRR